MSKDVHEYIKRKMENAGFNHLETRPPVNYDVLVMLFRKPGSPAAVAVTLSGVELFNVGDKFQGLADARVDQAIKTWDAYHDDRGKE